MLVAEYGEVQSQVSLDAKELRHARNGDPQCAECGSYANWHYGDCPEWIAIVRRIIAVHEKVEMEAAMPPCIHGNEIGGCLECYNQ